MKKLIDAQTAYDVLTDYYHHTTDTQHEALREALGRVPTVDAVPARHGRWIWRNYPGYQYQCDQCKRWAMFESKFCPNCGALMKWWKDGDGND